MDEQDISNFSTSSSHRLPTVSASAALEEASLKSPPIPTNLRELDSLFTSTDFGIGAGQGLPRGQLTEIYGPPGSGKTALCMQLAANALNQDSRAHVCWIDTAGPIPNMRFKEFLQRVPSEANGNNFAQADSRSSSPRYAASLDNKLSRLHHLQILTLPHLLALFLHSSPAFPPPSTTLIILDNISTLFNVSFPYRDRSSGSATGTKASAISFASTRRFAIAGDLAAALSKLAALKSIAVVVVNQTSTSIQGMNRAVLKPAVVGREWDAGVAMRCAIYQDFADADVESASSDDPTGTKGIGKHIWRWIEIVKGGRRDQQRGKLDRGILESSRRRRVAFAVGENGLHEITPVFGPTQAAPILPLSLPKTAEERTIPQAIAEFTPSPPKSEPTQPSTRKRKAAALDAEVADSEDEDDDEIPLPPPPSILPTSKTNGSSRRRSLAAEEEEEEEEEVDEYGSMAIAEEDLDFEEVDLGVESGEGDDSGNERAATTAAVPTDAAGYALEEQGDSKVANADTGG